MTKGVEGGKGTVCFAVVSCPQPATASKDRLILVVENLDAVSSEVVGHLVIGVDG